MIGLILGVIFGVLAFVGLIAAGASVRILREYERGVVFRLGRLSEQKGPGVVLLIPAVDRLVRVSLRTVTLTIPAQEVITRDNVPARVTAVTYYRVVDPNKSVVEVENVLAATSQIAQTTLRSVLGKAELDTLLAERERLNEDLQQIIDDQTEPWGIKVTTVEIKDVEIPDAMQRAMGAARVHAGQCWRQQAGGVHVDVAVHPYVHAAIPVRGAVEAVAPGTGEGAGVDGRPAAGIRGLAGRGRDAAVVPHHVVPASGVGERDRLARLDSGELGREQVGGGGDHALVGGDRCGGGQRHGQRAQHGQGEQTAAAKTHARLDGRTGAKFPSP